MAQPLQIFGIRTRKIAEGDDYVDAVFEGLEKEGLKVEDSDVFVVTSKIVSLSENRVVKLDTVKPRPEAEAIAARERVDPRTVELVMQEAEEIYGMFNGSIVTSVRGALQLNAGIDRSNIPDRYGCAVLYPLDPDRSARHFRDEVLRRTGKRVGVILSDSTVLPLRKGSMGMAIGVAGFNPLVGERGAVDVWGHQTELAGRKERDGQANVDPDAWILDAKAINGPDCLAAACTIVVGETNEQMPAALIKGARIKVTDQIVSSKEFIGSLEKDRTLGGFIHGSPRLSNPTST